jgi:ankyrin repeat protein
MKHLLLTTIAAVLLVGWGPQPPDISIHEAAGDGNIKAVKQHLAAGTDVDAKATDLGGTTPLSLAAYGGHKEVAELLIAKGANVNPFWVIPMLGTHKPEMATPRKPSD